MQYFVQSCCQTTMDMLWMTKNTNYTWNFLTLSLTGWWILYIYQQTFLKIKIYLWVYQPFSFMYIVQDINITWINNYYALFMQATTTQQNISLCKKCFVEMKQLFVKKILNLSWFLFVIIMWDVIMNYWVLPHLSDLDSIILRY